MGGSRDSTNRCRSVSVWPGSSTLRARSFAKSGSWASAGLAARARISNVRRVHRIGRLRTREGTRSSGYAFFLQGVKSGDEDRDTTSFTFREDAAMRVFTVVTLVAALGGLAVAAQEQ